MAPFVGPAKTFISYAQAGKWGDLVAAVADGGADRERMVWIDIFAVRQWPSESPDLDFASTIDHCKYFLIVCSYQKEVLEMSLEERFSRNLEVLPFPVRRQISFLRVWCLVEIHAACQKGMPIIMKAGSYKRKDDESVEFKSNGDMLDKLSYFIDIRNAEATVASDKSRILASIESGVGADALNSKARGAIFGGYAIAFDGCASIGCAVMEDPEPLKLVLSENNKYYLFAAAGGGYKDLLKKFLDVGTDINQVSNEHGSSALLYATEAGHTVCAEMLLNHGAAVNQQNNRGMTPLILAAVGGHLACIEMLLNHGADIHQEESNCATAMMYAALGGHTKIICMLLSQGAEIEHKSKNGGTALIGACIGGFIECAEMLLSHGAEINSQTNSGMTALMATGERGYTACAEMLLNHGADIDITDINGKTALAFASEKGHTFCTEMLQRYISQTV